MLSGNHSDIVFLVVIAGRKQKEVLSQAITKTGGHIVSIVYAKGSVKSSYIRDMLGLVHEEDKVVIKSLMPNLKSDTMMDILNEQFNFKEPNTGIAFTVSVEKLSF